MTPDEAKARATFFKEGKHRLAITEAAFFREKAALFPNSVFLVGYNIYELIVKNPDDLEIFRKHEVKFAVADRDEK